MGAGRCPPRPRTGSGSQYLPFNYGLFERRLLEFVRDLTPADVLPPKTSQQQAELGRLATWLGELEHRIDRTKAKIATAPDVDGLLDVLTDSGATAAGGRRRARAGPTRGLTVDEAAVLHDAKSLVQRLAETKGDALFVLAAAAAADSLLGGGDLGGGLG